MQLLNKSKNVRTVLAKRIGNETGQQYTINPGSSITLPDDKNIIFYDTLNGTQINKKPRLVINKDGYFE
ncbi:MAG: hypothetical protein LBR22_02470 [Desulfovibrio sp.]|jgi:hypothetical protein|nr:hypothetical protein [Desulfovibrio sp.]